MTPAELSKYRGLTAEGRGPSPNGFLLYRYCDKCKKRRQQEAGCKLKIARSRFEKTRFICRECANDL